MSKFEFLIITGLTLTAIMSLSALIVRIKLHFFEALICVVAGVLVTAVVWPFSERVAMSALPFTTTYFAYLFSKAKIWPNFLAFVALAYASSYFVIPWVINMMK